MYKAWVSARKLNSRFPNTVPEEITLHLGAFESAEKAQKIARRYSRRRYLRQFPYIGTPQLFIWSEKIPNGGKHHWSTELMERPVKTTGLRLIPTRRTEKAGIATPHAISVSA